MAKGQSSRESLALRVLDFIRAHLLAPVPPQLLVAVSGGQDSVCLLHVLVQLREELNLKLHVAHLNHQLRGADSEADAGYVARLAQQLGVPATIGQRDVKAYQAQHHLSLEEAAREVRYAFLAQVADSVETGCVAVGHTSDDHVETVLMHIIRGTGTRGLRGLQPSSQWPSSDSNLKIIRPLLEVSRQETAAYCQSHQLVPREDVSNLSLSPLRNRIRLQLLPLLKGYNPRIIEALLRTARIADDDFAFLERESARWWGDIAQRHGEAIVLGKKKFLALPPALQRYLLRMAIEKLSGSLKDVEARHIEEIMSALNKPAGRRLSLPGGLLLAIEYGQYFLGQNAVALSPFPVLGDEIALETPGETVFPGWCVRAAVVNREQLADEKDEFTAYLDLDKIGGKLTVRRRRPGDRFQPLGMEKPKMLGEFMIAAKIPRAWRQRVPIVCSPQHILWIVGWRIDDRVKVTPDTGRVLRLEFKRIPGDCGQQ